MNFDTPLFLSVFLPLLLALYWLIPGEKGKNVILLAAGLVFYAFGGLAGVGLLLLAAAGNYLFGLLLMKKWGGKAVLALAVAANLLFLGTYKYLDFLAAQVLGLPDMALGLAAPVGISFFTFKAISYLVDTWRDETKGTRSFWAFLLYLSFFPQVMAGPITRFSQFAPQIAGRSGGNIAPGLRRFILGLGKKVLFAGQLAKTVDSVFALAPGALDARLAWVGAIAYLLQIYFDFSGYSDMAIGLGRMFGFDTPENFRYPYAALTITDFWRRWHISLSSWFRDYLYIPLGGNRKGRWRTALNKAVVFTLCGLWHGAAWTFLLWGAWHGFLSAVESLRRPDPKTFASRLAWRGWTLLAVCLGFVMFRAGSVGQGFSMMAAMFAFGQASPAGEVAFHTIVNARAALTMALGAVFCLPWLDALKQKPRLQAVGEPVSYVLCLPLLALCLMALAAGGFAPFIYFQF